jgi:hypothetical protein
MHGAFSGVKSVVKGDSRAVARDKQLRNFDPPAFRLDCRSENPVFLEDISHSLVLSMLSNLVRGVSVLLLLAALACGLLGYHKLSQSWPLQEQAKKLFNEAYALKDQGLPYQHVEQQGDDFSHRAHELRHPGEWLLISAGLLGIAGVLGLILPPLAGLFIKT